MRDSLFVDANVFMYLAGNDVQYREACRRDLLAATEQGALLIATTEVLQEIFHDHATRRRPEDVRTVYEAVTDICEEILPVTEHQTARALELLVRHPGLPARDALHVATMKAHGVERILSADPYFDEIDNVTRVDPLGPPSILRLPWTANRGRRRPSSSCRP